LDIYGQAHYSLADIKKALSNPTTRYVTRTARQDAVSLGYASDTDMFQRVQQLKNSEIYKTMESEMRPGSWQDVYRTNDDNQEIYIKIQLSPDGKEGGIIAFKER